MKDSNSVRARIMDFLKRENGRVSSGVHDNLVAWMFYQLDSSSYAHERVSDLKVTLESMAKDGLIELTILKDTNKIIGIEISRDKDKDEVKMEEDVTSESALELKLSKVQAEKRELARKLADTEAAFEELSHEAVTPADLQDRDRYIKELEQKLNEPRSCAHEEEIAHMKEDHARQMAAQLASNQEVLAIRNEEFSAYRKDAQREKNRLTSKIDLLTRKCHKLEDDIADMLSEPLGQLTQKPQKELQHL